MAILYLRVSLCQPFGSVSYENIVEITWELQGRVAGSEILCNMSKLRLLPDYELYIIDKNRYLYIIT